MGRAYRYQRRMSHIIISVAEKGGANLAVTVGEDSEVSAAPVKSRAKKLVAAAKKSTTGKKAAPGGAAKHAGGHKDHKGGGHTAGSKKTTEKKTGKKNK
jgi:large subunit ribosomal protein L22